MGGARAVCKGCAGAVRGVRGECVGWVCRVYDRDVLHFCVRLRLHACVIPQKIFGVLVSLPTPAQRQPRPTRKPDLLACAYCFAMPAYQVS